MKEGQKKVLLLDNVHKSAKKLFEEAGYFVERSKEFLPQEELIAKVRGGGFHVLGVRSKTAVNKKVLEDCPSLEVVGSFCVGTKQIATDFAAEKDVISFNAKHENTRSVAEKVIGTIICQASGIAEANIEMHKGKWNKTAKGNHEVRGKTLGIIGYGNIGSQVSVMAEMLGMNVIYYDSKDCQPIGNAKSLESQKEVFEQADFVTIHASGENENEKMVTLSDIESMKPSAYLINYARAFLLEEGILVKALRDKIIKGVATDVFDVEPGVSESDFDNPLMKFNNAILTPHMGASTKEAQENIAEAIFKKIQAYYKDGMTEGSVNFPEVSPSRKPNTHRIVCVHKNETGVSGKLSKILGDNGLNIKQQTLATGDTIGYVIFDVEKLEGAQKIENIVQELEKLDVNIRSEYLK